MSILLVGLSLWAIGIQFRTVPLRISKETTFVTAPLKSDGKSVDFLKAFEAVAYSDKIATEENGYRLFVQRFGPIPDLKLEQVESLYVKLGLDPNSVSADLKIQEPFQVLDAYCQSPKFDVKFIRALDAQMDGKLPTEEPYAAKTYDNFDAEQVLSERTSSPWTLDDLPMMRDWVAETTTIMPVIADALNKSTFEIPLTPESEDEMLLGLTLSDTQRMRSVARILMVRANYLIGAGDIDGAIDQIVTCKKLGRTLQHGWSSIDLLIGIAVEGTAESIGIATSVKYQPSKQQLIRLRESIDRIPERTGVDHILFFERLAALNLIQNFSLNGNELGDEGIQWANRFGLNWNSAARRINHLFDTKQLLRDEFTRIENVWDLWLIERRSVIVADSIVEVLPAVVEAERRQQCGNHIYRIILAMLLYEKDHGTLPPAFTVDEKGNPLHSWRVLILPYLGQQELYDQLKLDEPWDSPANKKFWAADVPFYQCPSDPNAKRGQTNYSVIVGSEAAFDGSVGKKLDSFGPNSGSLILVAERLDEVCWMDPSKEIPLAIAERGVDGKDLTTRKLIGGIASEHPAGAQVGTRDGSVRFLVEEMDVEVLKLMLRGTFSGRRVY